MIKYNFEDIINDSCFTPYEADLIKHFRDVCVEKSNVLDIHDADSWNINIIADQCHIDLSSFHKEGPVIQSFWVIFLATMKSFFSDSDYKYVNLGDFLKAYSGYYDSLSSFDQELLWKTANWMHILFTIIPARKNKGLAMQVIPKLVEGWEAKYITGSGQTKATANRVHIFETEGEIQAFHRGRAKVKKPQSRTNFKVNHQSKSQPNSPLSNRKPLKIATKKRKTPPNEVFEVDINASKYKSRLESLRKKETISNSDDKPTSTSESENFINVSDMNNSKYKSRLEYLRQSYDNDQDLTNSHETDKENSDSHSDDHSIDQDSNDSNHWYDNIMANNRNFDDFLYDWINDPLAENLKLFRGNSYSMPLLSKEISTSSIDINRQYNHLYNIPYNSAYTNLSLIHPESLSNDIFMQGKMGPSFDKQSQSTYIMSGKEDNDLLDLLAAYK